MSKDDYMNITDDILSAPREFTNRLSELGIKIDRDKWRQSPEWKMFVSGYNCAVSECNSTIKAKYNFGANKSRLFGVGPGE